MSREQRHLPFAGTNGEYVDALYQRWASDPETVDPQWRHFFEGFELGAARPATGGTLAKQGQVDNLIYHYRDIGHLAATLNPLGIERPVPERLNLESFGFDQSDLDTVFDVGDLPLEGPATLAEVLTLLRETYCRNVGVEYMHIQDPAQRRWLQEKMEGVHNRPVFNHDRKMRVLWELIEAASLESFLDRRYTGKKRFSLQGAESLIPLLNEMVEHGPDDGVEEFTFGMAHRGRLNVLVNILNKSYDELFTEFAESWTEDFLEGGGDVKYHRGYSSDHTTSTGKNVRLTLSPNPSHLEFVNPVVLGRARAKQRIREDVEGTRCVPVLIHGDGAFPGQGVVAECLNMVHLDGYTVGGAIHVVVNNQLGFTTNQHDLFSGHYCTDIAKAGEAPVFHVNGDDPEACVFVGALAVAYRQRFKNDVVIDLWCYRKYGHNEGDEATSRGTPSRSCTS
jgi:2-oxoglutarate dehydrogenase E1 component